MHHHVLRFGRRVGIALAGGAMILLGVAGLALPVMPGWGLILLGLGILSLEFERPRRWLALLKARLVGLKDRVTGKPPRGDDS